VSASSEIRDVREVIALAVRTSGRKRGWALAANLLGTTERWVKSATYGEPIAAPCATRAARARLALAEQRLAQLDAEATELREILNASRSHVDVGR
jgi:hypothetical protein